MTDIRDCLAMLRELNHKPEEKTPVPATDDNIKSAFERLRNFQGD